MHAGVLLGLMATALASQLDSAHIGEPNTGASRGHGNNDAVSGDCCAVWDTSRGMCLEAMASKGYGKTCHRFDGPPKAGSADAVPKCCYIGRMETHMCLEHGDTEVSDGQEEPKGGPDIHNGGGHGITTELPKHSKTAALPSNFVTVTVTRSA